MKDHGKSTHDDLLIMDILEAIVEDLKSFEKAKSKSRQNSLQPIINELKSIKDENSRSQSKMNAFLEDLRSIQESEGSSSGNLDSVINNLEQMEAGQSVSG